MRTRLFLPALTASLLFINTFSLAQNKASSTTDTAAGLIVTTFVAPMGSVRVYLPDDMAGENKKTAPGFSPGTEIRRSLIAA